MFVYNQNFIGSWEHDFVCYCLVRFTLLFKLGLSKKLRRDVNSRVRMTQEIYERLPPRTMIPQYSTTVWIGHLYLLLKLRISGLIYLGF